MSMFSDDYIQKLKESEANKKMQESNRINNAINVALACLNEFPSAAVKMGLQPSYDTYRVLVKDSIFFSRREYETRKSKIRKWELYQTRRRDDPYKPVYLYDNIPNDEKMQLANGIARYYHYDIEKIKKFFERILTGEQVVLHY